MTQTLREILNNRERQQYATESGTRTHAQLRHVVIDGANTAGAPELIAQISSRPDIAKFFCTTAQTEVPIAGTVRGKFISRRIDRMLIDDTAKTVHIVDYKTDTDRNARRKEYTYQLREYAELLRQIYPGYTVQKYIIWTHNWDLEEIC